MRYQPSNSAARIAIVISAVVVILSFVFRGSNLSAAGESEALYKAKCAMCHGPDGAGGTPTGKSLKVRDMSTADVQKQSDADLTAVIAKGKNKMPPFEKSLKPDQIKDLVAQIRGFKK